MRRQEDIPDKLTTSPTAEERSEIARLAEAGLVMNSTIVVPIKANDWFRGYFAQAYGNHRWMWNHLVEQSKEAYEQDPKWRFNWMKAKSDFVVEKRAHEEWSFLEKTACDAYKEPFRDLDRSLKKFFKDKFDRNCKNKAGFPHFQKKRKLSGSFRINGTQTAIEKGVRGEYSSKKNHYLRIPKGDKWPGSPDKWVMLSEPIPYNPLQVLSVTVKRDGTRFYAHIAVLVLKSVHQALHSENLPNRTAAGLDWNVKNKATLANPVDCVEVKPFKPARKDEKKARRLQKSLSRKVHPKTKEDVQLGVVASKNYLKAQLKLRNVEGKIKNQRVDHERKTASAITRCCSAICIEDTNNKGLLRNHKLAKSIANASPYRFRKTLEWMASWRNVYVHVADRFFPSTKTCSNCGAKYDIGLSDRTYRCASCGFTCGRDENSSINLFKQLREAIAPPLEPGCPSKVLGTDRAEVTTANLDALRVLLFREGLVSARELEKAVTRVEKAS